MTIPNGGHLTGEILPTESAGVTGVVVSGPDARPVDESASPIPESSSSTALVSPTGALEDEAGAAWTPATTTELLQAAPNLSDDEPDMPDWLARKNWIGGRPPVEVA